MLLFITFIQYMKQAEIKSLKNEMECLHLEKMYILRNSSRQEKTKIDICS